MNNALNLLATHSTTSPTTSRAAVAALKAARAVAHEDAFGFNAPDQVVKGDLVWCIDCSTPCRVLAVVGWLGAERRVHVEDVEAGELVYNLADVRPLQLWIR
jgi:hypothetical protein